MSLRDIKDVRAVDALMVALADTDDLVRREAARALGSIGDARAVDALMVALAHTDGYLRPEAARALGSIGDARTADALITAFADKLQQQHKGLSRCVQDDEVILELLRASESILECTSASVHQSVLHRLTELGAIEIHYSSCGADWKAFGNSRLIQLARQELIRRGLEA